MAKLLDRLTGRKSSAGLIRSLSNWVEKIKDAPISELKEYRRDSRKMLKISREALEVIENRLRKSASSHLQIIKAVNSDYAYRPKPWTRENNPVGISGIANKTTFGSEVIVYHDCKKSEINLTQVRNVGAADLTPYGVNLDMFDFDGSFFSMIVALPKNSVKGVTIDHIYRVSFDLECEYGDSIFVRLNLEYGTNVEQRAQELKLKNKDQKLEFDLSDLHFDPSKISSAQLEIIFPDTPMNQYKIKDLTIVRYKRAIL